MQFDSTPSANGVNERNQILVFQNPLVRMEPIIEDGDINEGECTETYIQIDKLVNFRLFSILIRNLIKFAIICKLYVINFMFKGKKVQKLLFIGMSN